MSPQVIMKVTMKKCIKTAKKRIISKIQAFLS